MPYIYFLRGQQHQTVVNIQSCLGGAGGGAGGGVNSCPIPFKLCLVCSVHGLVHVHNTFTDPQLSTTLSLCCGSVALFCDTSRPHPHPPQERERRVLFQTAQILTHALIYKLFYPYKIRYLLLVFYFIFSLWGESVLISRQISTQILPADICPRWFQ